MLPMQYYLVDWIIILIQNILLKPFFAMRRSLCNTYELQNRRCCLLFPINNYTIQWEIFGGANVRYLASGISLNPQQKCLWFLIFVF